MSVDIEKVSNFDMGYPGIEIASEIKALEVSLISLKEFIPFIQQQYQLREKRKVNKEFETLDRDDWLRGSDLMYEEEAIDDISNVVFPRFFRVTLIGTIWAVYEAAISDICSYLQKKENKLLSLRNIYGKSHKDKVKKYFKGVLDMEVPISDELFLELEMIKKVRNLIAHRNGRVIEKNVDKNILQYVKNQKGISIVNGAIAMDDFYIQQQFETVKKALGLMDHAIANKYKWMYAIRYE